MLQTYSHRKKKHMLDSRVPLGFRSKGKMQTTSKKRFFTKHAKSSAMVVSLAVHAVLVVVALSFVAVTVIQRDGHNFESRRVVRPKMALKKLQVPVKIEKKRPKPRMRKQITVKTRLDRNMPDIKMPELVGLKGGMGSMGSGGLGGAGGVGFSLPEIEIFGIKGKGEKIFLILDSSPRMMYDEMGGIPAYTIIKDELVRIVEGLGATTLFNVVVFDGGNPHLAFPSMVSANAANAEQVKNWLAPLNAVHSGMGDRDYGVRTLGKGGVQRKDDLRIAEFKEKGYSGQGGWYRPAMIAMQQQADTVFLLTCAWGNQRVAVDEKNTEWRKTTAGKKWQKCFEEGKKLLEEENKERAARGESPRVIAMHSWAINMAYFPNIERPPKRAWYNFTPLDFTHAFLEMRARHKPAAIQTKSGLARKKSHKFDFSFNVIQFVKEGEEPPRSGEHFRKLASLCRGNYRTVAGLEAIQSYVKAPKMND